MNDSDPFVLDAAVHGKPVMICESSPIHNNGSDNPANWQNWYVPYFSKIAQHAHLKAFTYISDSWDRSGFWESWATSLLDANTPAATGLTLGRNRTAHRKSRPRFDVLPPAAPVRLPRP